MVQVTSALQQSLLTHLEFSQWVLQKNLEDITHEESLKQPVPGGNCLNWVVGHILFSRHELLEVFGAVTADAKANLARYERGSDAIAGSSDAIEFSTLVEILGTTFPIYKNVLENVTLERLAEKAPFSPAKDPEETIETLLTKFAFHEDYHTGQTGILRRLTGKPGMLR